MKHVTLSRLLKILMLTALGGSLTGSVQGESGRLPKGVELTTPSMPEFTVAEMKSINEELSREVTPATNGVVWLLQGVGQECLGTPGFRDPTMEMLGVARFSEQGPVLEDIVAFGRRRAKAGKNYEQEGKEFSNGIFWGPTKIWTREEYGVLAEYLDENTAAFDLISEGVKQPGYYWPLISDPNDPPQRLMSASFGLELRLIFVAKLLACRGNLLVHEGKAELALQDALTIHRLAVMMSYGSPFDVTLAKAHQIDSFAFIVEKNLLESGNLTGEIARSYLKQLSDLKPIAPDEFVADRGERAIVRQEIALVRLTPDDLKAMFEDPDEQSQENSKTGKPKPPKPLPKIDWNMAMARGDEIQNRLVEALAAKNPEKQTQMFDELDREYAEWEKHLDEVSRKVVHDLKDKNDTASASRFLGESMARALRSQYRQRQATDDRGTTRRNLARVGMALIALQRETGDFPSALSELSPQILSNVPDDINLGKPFTYQRESKESARLISWGENRMDDAGKVPNDDQIVILR